MRALSYEEFLSTVRYNECDNEEHLSEAEYYEMVEASKMD